jgi:hypothetical protein
MVKFGEQPTSSNRERLSSNEESAEDVKGQLAQAMESGDADKIIDLGGQLKSANEQKEEFKNQDEEEAHAENIKRQLTEAVASGDADKIVELGEQMKNSNSQEKKDNQAEKIVSPEQLKANLDMLEVNAAKLDKIPEKVLQSKEGQETTQSFMGKMTGRLAGFRDGIVNKLATLDSWKGKEVMAYTLIGASTAAIIGPVMLQLARSKWPEVGAVLDSAPDAVQQFIHLDIWAKVAETFNRGSDMLQNDSVNNLLADISSGKESISSLNFNQSDLLNQQNMSFFGLDSTTLFNNPTLLRGAAISRDMGNAMLNMPLVAMAGAGMFGAMSKIGSLANKFKTKTAA